MPFACDGDPSTVSNCGKTNTKELNQYEKRFISIRKHFYTNLKDAYSMPPQKTVIHSNTQDVYVYQYDIAWPSSIVPHACAAEPSTVSNCGKTNTKISYEHEKKYTNAREKKITIPKTFVTYHYETLLLIATRKTSMLTNTKACDPHRSSHMRALVSRRPFPTAERRFLYQYEKRL